MIGSEIQFTTGCSYTPTQVLAKLVPGAVVTVSRYGSRPAHIFIFKAETDEALPDSVFISGRRITRDGFLDMRTQNDFHYIARLSYIRNVTSPEARRDVFPHCQLHS